MKTAYNVVLVILLGVAVCYVVLDYRIVPVTASLPMSLLPLPLPVVPLSPPSLLISAPAEVYPGEPFAPAACASGTGEWKANITAGGMSYSWFPRSPIGELAQTVSPAVLPADWTGRSVVTIRVSAYAPGGSNPVSTVSREIILAGPTVTPAPTAAPSGDCARGLALIRVSGIPEMTDGNKDNYNKQLLFCLRDENNLNFVGVYHRYLQPDWPEGPWWPTWRIEAGSAGCVREWSIWQSSDLPGSSADFRIEWDARHVTVTHTGTGDAQSLTLDSRLALSQLSGDAGCDPWGWHSPAFASLMDWSCVTRGEPEPCPPTPSPAAGPAGFLSGEATVKVSGIAGAPNPENGVLFCLSTSDLQTGVWVRLTDEPGTDRWQIRGYVCQGIGGNEDWIASDWHSAPDATDGNYHIEWSPGEITVTDPELRSVTLAVPWMFAPWSIDTTQPWAAGRPGEPAGCWVKVIDYWLGTPGRGEVCP